MFIIIHVVFVGLPFHSHGKTWLGLITGSKIWFLHRPGLNLSKYNEHNWNAFLNTSSLLREIYGDTFRDDFTFPDNIYTISTTLSNSVLDSDIIILTQRSGDIIYVPDGWAHMTINLGMIITHIL